MVIYWRFIQKPYLIVISVAAYESLFSTLLNVFERKYLNKPTFLEYKF